MISFRSIISFCLLNVQFIAFAQSNQWQWSRKGNCSSFDYAICVTADSSNNVCLAGSFLASNMYFDSTVLQPNGGLDANFFIAKYDGTGNLLWAKKPKGTANDYPYSVASDKYNNTYVSGQFSTPVFEFDSTHSLYNHGGYDGFVAKYDSSGNVIWAKDIGGINDEEKIFLTCDAEGNTAIACYAKSYDLMVDTISVLSPGGMVVAKFNSAGSAMWAKQLSPHLNPVGVVMDTIGNVYITGWSSYYGFYVGTYWINNTFQSPDMFLIKMDPLGNLIWVKNAKTWQDNPTSIVCDNAGDIIITGYFVRDHTLGSSLLHNANPLMNTDDFFIVKYNSNGTILWAKSNGGKGEENTSSVTCDPAGNIYVGGVYLNDSVIVGPWITFDKFKPFITGGDIFIVKYDQNGTPLGYRTAGGNDNDRLFSIAADHDGNVYAAGQFVGSFLDFGGNIINSSGYMDMFIAKTTSIVGVSELSENQSQLNIYPNPFDKELYLKNTSEQGKIIICDLSGNIVTTIQSSRFETIIKTNNLNPGFYVLSYKDDSKQESYKLLKF